MTPCVHVVARGGTTSSPGHSLYTITRWERRGMWSSLLLLTRRSFPGRQWTGNRKVKKITYDQRQNKKKDAGIVAEVNSHTHFNKFLPPLQQVEGYLSMPYLTVAEEECQTLAKKRRAAHVPPWQKKKQKSWFRKSRTPFEKIVNTY